MKGEEKYHKKGILFYNRPNIIIIIMSSYAKYEFAN